MYIYLMKTTQSQAITHKQIRETMSGLPFRPSSEMFREQRVRLGAALKSAFGDNVCAVFQAGSEIPRNSSDTNYLFRQESFFQYLFGYEVPDCQGAVFPDGRGAIFIPRLPESYAVWMGTLPTPDSVVKETGIEEVYFIDDLAAVLKQKNVDEVHVMNGRNTDSDLPVISAPVKVDGVNVKKDWLHDTVVNQRVFKTKREIELLKWANKISSDAHIEVMKLAKPGMSQHHLEATFVHFCHFFGGMRHQSYTCICATGADGATLHYPHNDKAIADGSMALLDMGGELNCYATDITCSFPVNGTFTQPQRSVYNAVLDAQMSVFHAMRPGVSWVDMHKLALSVMAKHLIQMGIFAAGTSVDDVMANKLMRLFQPHGLGHLIGLDVHDVGGYMKNCPPRPTESDCCKLRTARILEPNMFITVEPGLYFNQVLLEQAFANPNEAKYLNQSRIREFWNFGGVRIEDNVVVTEDGILNLTCCPRSVEEIESTMCGNPFVKSPTAYKNVM